MKVLLTLALVAMATANLEEPAQVQGISMMPLFVPADVVEAFQKDLENNPPINTVQIVDSFVDDSMDVAPLVLNKAPAPESFEDSPINPEAAPADFVRVVENFEEAPMPVHFVDVAEDAVFSPVMFVEEEQEPMFQELPRPQQFENPMWR